VPDDGLWAGGRNPKREQVQITPIVRSEIIAVIAFCVDREMIFLAFSEQTCHYQLSHLSSSILCEDMNMDVSFPNSASAKQLKSRNSKPHISPRQMGNPPISLPERP